MNLTRLSNEKREWTEEELVLLEETALAVAQSTIQVAMDEASLSRAEIARRMGCARSFVTKLLQGDHNLTIKTLARVLGACGRQVQLEATKPQCTWASQPRLSIAHVQSSKSGRSVKASPVYVMEIAA